MKTIVCNIPDLRRFQMQRLGQLRDSRHSLPKRTLFPVKGLYQRDICAGAIASGSEYQTMKTFLGTHLFPLGILTLLVLMGGCAAIPLNSNGLDNITFNDGSQETIDVDLGNDTSSDNSDGSGSNHRTAQSLKRRPR